jgi:WD40 repeat protein
VLFSLNAEGVQFHAIALSPDENRLAACESSFKNGSHKHSVRVWDVATQEELFSLELPLSSKGYSLAYSPNGSRIACGGDNFHLCDASTGKRLRGGAISRSINAHYHMPSVAFSPDGSRVVGACSTNAVRVWELPAD